MILYAEKKKTDYDFEPASPDSLKKYVESVIHDNRYRNYKDPEELNRVADYIANKMESFGLSCYYQDFVLEGKDSVIYRNIICRIDQGKEKTFIIGAHYDVCVNQEGADDNASGVAGLIETARILSGNKDRLNYNFEFAAYTLEEPPFFGTKEMGSYIHAESIENKGSIRGMISLEMIGYFTEKKIQKYPAGIGLFYPDHGNFIASVSNFSSKWISDRFDNAMSLNNKLDVQKLVAPSWITGVDFSDHRNYRLFGIDAIMITDTAFNRNKNYHEVTDTIETLDFIKMGYVVDGVVRMFLK